MSESDHGSCTSVPRDRRGNGRMAGGPPSRGSTWNPLQRKNCQEGCCPKGRSEEDFYKSHQKVRPAETRKGPGQNHRPTKPALTRKGDGLLRAKFLAHCLCVSIMRPCGA